jgi:hypothetical protein
VFAPSFAPEPAQSFAPSFAPPSEPAPLPTFDSWEIEPYRARAVEAPTGYSSITRGSNAPYGYQTAMTGQYVSASTLPIWILALYPAPYLFLSALAAIAPNQIIGPLSALASLLVLGIQIATPIWDYFVLRGRGLNSASPIWLLLGPIAYLIARRVVLRRARVISNAPGNVFAIGFIAGIVMIVVLMPTLIAGRLSSAAVQDFETQIAQRLSSATASNWTLSCPDDVPATSVGATFICHATNTAGQQVDIQGKVVGRYEFTASVIGNPTLSS